MKNPGQPIAVMKDVTKSYLKGRNSFQVLKNVNLSIDMGEKIALVGPSGAGKTTLLYLLGLMDIPTSGSYTLLGSNPLALSDSARSRLRGQTIGFVFQNYNLLPHLRTWENVALPLHYSGISIQKRLGRAVEMLERVGLADKKDHYPSELSGGQEQRIAIARALVMKPKLILADEPTGNLDSRTGERILDLLDEVYAHGSTLITVTHSPEVASRAKRIIHLRDGQIINDQVQPNA
ncbi:MAG: ABC transporter ATP-binding protein [Deinococcus sp.]|nr:ABC transporter ATP-binding protein [Deinococcus sp.]